MHKLLLAIFSFSFVIAAGGGGPSSQVSNPLLQSFKEIVNIKSKSYGIIEKLSKVQI